jgi:hypothetical protein
LTLADVEGMMQCSPSKSLRRLISTRRDFIRKCSESDEEVVTPSCILFPLCAGTDGAG